MLHILKRALEKTPDKRYPSANDFLTDLQRVKKDLAGGSEPAVNQQQTELGLPLNRDMIATMTMQSEGQRALIFSEEALPPAQSVNMSFSAKLQFLTKLTLATEDYHKTAPGSNPYLNRLMIQNPNDFYGRSTELTRIYERIKAVRPQSMSIVGVRRIGKSSLLKAIHRPENRRKHLPNPEEYVFVFVDAQAKRNVELAELFQYIYQELQREYRGMLQVNVEPGYDGLREIVQTFQGAGLKLIFLWDEFESVTKNQKFGPEFYAYFRSLANNFNVAYITTSSDQLQSLCHAKEISDSPFFNIFTNLRLGVFKPEEAIAFISQPSAQAGRPLAPHKDFILNLAGYFPFFLQMACSALFSSTPVEKSDYKKVKEIFLEEAKPHFQEFWERFDESERAVIVALAKGRALPREHAFALKDLTQAGFVSDGKVFSSAFAEFVGEVTRTQKSWWQWW
jgi:serine/threonine-protein kinase